MQDSQERNTKLLYKALQGYLSQLPLPKDVHEVFYEKAEWEHIDNTIGNLNSATGKNYDEHKITERFDADGYPRYVTVATVRSKLGGLINILHEEYFSYEPVPFSGSSRVPNTIINNQNTQQQSQHQQQEQKIELEQMLQNAQEMIQAEWERSG